YVAVGYGVMGEFLGGEGTRRRIDGRTVQCLATGCAEPLTEREFRGARAPTSLGNRPGRTRGLRLTCARPATPATAQLYHQRPLAHQTLEPTHRQALPALIQNPKDIFHPSLPALPP